MAHTKAPLYKIVDQKVTKTRMYQLIRFFLPKMSTAARKTMMEKILDENGAIGLIEWWIRGSIVQKPKWQFYAILIFET